MAKLPSFQFYPGDWLKDPALRCCSPEARGTWMDLLCLMFEAPQRGVLRTKNCKKMEQISIKKLSRSIPGCKPKMIQELIDAGVCRVARRDGALYSKRLVRDELKRRHKALSGAKGGQAKRKQNPSKPEANTQANPGSSSSSSTSVKRRCTSEAVQLAAYLLEKIRERKPDYRKPNMEAWAKHVDLMIRRDKRSPSRIREVIAWCQRDAPKTLGAFAWQDNILSTRKLREKFDKLELAMAANKPAIPPPRRGLRAAKER